MNTYKNYGGGNKKRRKRTVKGHYDDIFLQSTTPVSIQKISAQIARDIETKQKSKSYSPSLNKKLVEFKLIPRNQLFSCNIEKASKGEEPLEISIPYYNLKDPETVVSTGKPDIFGALNFCFKYDTDEAKEVLLHNLKANRNIDPSQIITPIQSDSNCWFNTFFVTLFISDKGRKFFHFFRELMIKGVNIYGEEIPQDIKDSFALLNFAIEQYLTGSHLAYEFDTNVIIKSVYEKIPDNSHIFNVGEYGSPEEYYFGIMNYLDNYSMHILYLKSCDLGDKLDWKTYIKKYINEISQFANKGENYLPNIVIFTIFKQHANLMKKAIRFTINKAVYELDSASISDTLNEHFCATITCNGEEMVYDGASFHRLVPMKWKHNINRNVYWSFDTKKEKWNFTKCGQVLTYYRVK